MVEAIIIAFLALGSVMMIIGTLGVLRFGDLPTRLHAVAKADNLGLGFIVVGLVISALTGAGAEGTESSPGAVLKLVLVWLLALLGTAANSHLLAGHWHARKGGRGRERLGALEDPGGDTDADL